jgi:hypothetical protein
MLFVAMAHGDCWTERESAIRACLDQKRVVVLTYVAVAVAAYVFAVWRFARRR